LLKLNAETISFKSFFISTISALSKATSFQAHMLIHKSLFTNAIESFIQSQTIAILYQLDWIFFIIFHFSSGSISLKIFSFLIHTLFAIKFAENLLSQVIINTSIHIFFKIFIASLDVSFISSLTDKIDNISFSFHKNNTVFHCVANLS
jgi:hypothetical protein